jgi:hypothetical protein
MLSQNELKEWLYYDAASGNFIWKKTTRNGRGKSGHVTGSKDKEGYVVIGFQKKRYKAHRLAWLYMTGFWPLDVIDHIDGNPANNAWTNLREATCGQNQHNSKIPRNNKSGIKGVCWDNSREKWMASICINRKSKTLGYFQNIDEAEEIVKVARQKYHKDFANNG